MPTFETGCSFDHLATADLSTEYISVLDATITANGRNGTSSLRIPNQSNDYVIKSFTSAQTKCVGFAYRFVNTPSLAIAIFKEGSIVHTDLRVTAGGKLRVTRNGTPLGSDGPTTLSTGQYYYIEFKAKIADSPNGTVDVRLNGVSEISLTTQDTQNAGTSTTDRVVLGNDQGGASATITADYDDFYVADDFLGDIRVAYLSPTAEGNTIELTPLTGTDNSAMVDDITPDGNTTYVESSTTNQKDTYVMSNLPSVASTVHAVMVIANAVKDDAGARSIALIARHSGTETDSSDMTLNTTYDHFENTYVTKPGGGSWSSSDVDGMEVGVKVR